MNMANFLEVVKYNMILSVYHLCELLLNYSQRQEV